MGVLYKDNRLVPAIIITAALWLFFFLLDPINFTQQPPTELHIEPWLESPPQQPHWQPEAEPPQTQPQKAPETTASSPNHHESQPPPAPHHTEGKLSPEDVLLIVKTGGTSMWKRLLAHLLTTLAPERIPLQNIVIYSDSADKIGAYTVIDILANTTAETLSSPEFDVYRSQAAYAAHNAYLEAAGVDGDDWGPQGGWIVDKYKFVPLVQHAGENWPRAKWYIYMEDDTYLFLPSVLRYLERFDHRAPHWLGSYAAKSDVVFAQGGAGFALSRGAWEASFGRSNGRLAEEEERYTADHCCGDQVLGHALNRYGVRLGENGGDEVFRYGFNPLVHWTFAFEKWSWCLPLYSWHKVHARDVARYYELERSWDFSSPLRHGDFFKHMIDPDLKKRAEWWDNMSDKFRVTSANKANPPAPEGLKEVETWKDAWQSVDACEAACEAWDECIQWSFVEDLCKMDDKAIMGKGYAPEMSQRKTALITTSGWFKERLEKWNSHCDA